MRDLITKLAILKDLLLAQWAYWKKDVWPHDIDRPYCCSGRDCGCYGQTIRNVHGR